MEQDKEKNFASAVVYLYNDENSIISFIKGLNETLRANFLKYEVIVVNDKSSDNGAAKVKEYAATQEKSCITLLNMSYHQGIETAMNAGVDLAIGDFVFEFDTVVVDYSWSTMMDIYQHSLKGYDIVNACSAHKPRITSRLFYNIMNRYAQLQYNLKSETFRVLSRRAINRIHAISKSVPYRKAAYANCGLKMATLTYQCIGNIKSKKQTNRVALALNSLILFTDVAFRSTVYLTILMIAVTVGVAVYAMSYYMFERPVEGWTTTILFLSFSFCCLFIILAMVLKYLSLLLRMNFMKNTYVFESIEKL
jgi:dolichol-phosphate mannosyltransferase